MYFMWIISESKIKRNYHRFTDFVECTFVNAHRRTFTLCFKRLPFFFHIWFLHLPRLAPRPFHALCIARCLYQSIFYDFDFWFDVLLFVCFHLCVLVGVATRLHGDARRKCTCVSYTRFCDKNIHGFYWLPQSSVECDILLNALRFIRCIRKGKSALFARSVVFIAFFFLLVLTLEVHNTKKKNKMLEQIMTLVLFRGRTEGFVGIRDLRSDISHRNSSDDDYYYYYEHRCKPLCRDLDCLMLRCTATTKHVVCPFFCRRT